MTLDLWRLSDVMEPRGRVSLEAAVGLAMTNGHSAVAIDHRLKRLIESDGARATEQIISRELLSLLSRRFLVRMSAGVTDTDLAVQFDDTGRFILSQGQAVADDPVRPAALAYAVEA